MPVPFSSGMAGSISGTSHGLVRFKNWCDDESNHVAHCRSLGKQIVILPEIKKTLLVIGVSNWAQILRVLT